MKSNPNDNVYPANFDSMIHAKNGIKQDEILKLANGITKRELFAAMAMQGLLANSTWAESSNISGPIEYNQFNSGMAEHAVEMADALIKQLNSTEK